MRYLSSVRSNGARFITAGARGGFKRVQRAARAANRLIPRVGDGPCRPVELCDRNLHSLALRHTPISPGNWHLRNVKADVGQVEQMIMNLAVNARDAMPAGGTLTIETANIVLYDRHSLGNPDFKPGTYVMLGVSDTGTGMTPEVRRQIFEPFYTTKPKGSGTGLGLATVYGMVQQTGGLISVDTEPGCGSSFKIYLPQTDEAIVGSGPIVESDLHGDETILVVEDQGEVRRLLEVALTDYGYRVLSVAGGEDALSLLRTFDGVIHLLLADIVMPGMNGRQLANEVALERAGLRVLFMSGYPQNGITHEGILDEGVDYIQKPFTPNSLAKKVREVLVRR